MASAARLDIRSAHDVIAALSSPDLATRLALCQAAAAHPAHVLAYGAAAGVDLVLAFLSAARKRESLVYRKATLAAVVNFDDPRVVELFREVLQSSTESDVLRLAAKRVALDQTTASREFLRERLLNEQSPLRVRCIASALAAALDLSPAEKLRLILAGAGHSDAIGSFPRETDEAARDWAKELGGPFALRARRLLEGSGKMADLLALLPSWPSFADADQAWFLGWGSALFGSTRPPEVVCSMLTESLAQPAKAVVLAALRWCGACPNAVPSMSLEPHVASVDADLRLAALSAMPLDAVDWSQLARHAVEPTVRALAVERALSASDAAGDRLELAAVMEDGDWRVRKALVRGLHRSGSSAVESARGWLSHSSPHVRAGALQILLDHGQERWLMDALLA